MYLALFSSAYQKGALVGVVPDKTVRNIRFRFGTRAFFSLFENAPTGSVAYPAYFSVGTSRRGGLPQG
jgi:hypothetical protein